MDLTLEQIKMLADAERKMDSGEVPFVLWHGHRAMMTKDALDHFGLISGQTITDPIWNAIIEFNIAKCQEKIADQAVSEWKAREGLDC